jgi:hypothetical protein
MTLRRIIAPAAVFILLAVAYALVRHQPEKPRRLAVLAVVSLNNDEPIDSLRVGRHTFQVRKQDATQGSLDIRTDGKLVTHTTGATFTVRDFTDQPAGWTNGMDINGDSIPEVVVQEYTGGAHCCTSWRIFRAGRDVQPIYAFDNGHTDFFPLVDVNSDGICELQIFDWTFAYWKTGFSSSPAMRLIYSWQNGTYAFSPDLTRQPPLSEGALRKKAAALDWAQSEPEAGTPPQFWTDMLELIATGNAKQLVLYVALAWPDGRSGRSAFLGAFGQQLRLSAHWDDWNRLNGGNLEAALPK